MSLLMFVGQIHVLITIGAIRRKLVKSVQLIIPIVGPAMIVMMKIKRTVMLISNVEIQKIN